VAGVLVVGPRIGKFRKDGTIVMIQGHNLPMAVMGTLILAFGSVRLQTAGSTLAATEPRIAEISPSTRHRFVDRGVGFAGIRLAAPSRPDIAMACKRNARWLGGPIQRPARSSRRRRQRYRVLRS